MGPVERKKWCSRQRKPSKKAWQLGGAAWRLAKSSPVQSKDSAFPRGWPLFTIFRGSGWAGLEGQERPKTGPQPCWPLQPGRWWNTHHGGVGWGSQQGKECICAQTWATDCLSWTPCSLLSALSFADSVTLDKSLLSEPQLPHLQNKDSSTSWAFMMIKHLNKCKGCRAGPD